MAMNARQVVRIHAIAREKTGSEDPSEIRLNGQSESTRRSFR